MHLYEIESPSSPASKSVLLFTITEGADLIKCMRVDIELELGYLVIGQYRTLFIETAFFS